MAASLKSLGFDRYDIDARLRPALFVLFPVLLVGAVWAPQARTLGGAVISIAVACGGAMLLARVARRRGQAVQAKYAARWGPRGTAALLRWSNAEIDPATKTRYHRALTAAGHILPTTAEEAQDPDAADQAYLGCATWLLEQTRNKKKFDLLAAENIDYGFKRNLLGLRPLAWPILVAAFAVNATLALRHWSAGWDDTCTVALAVAVILAFGAIGWLWVNEDLVQHSSDTFAKRLLACCDVLHDRARRVPATRQKSTTARGTRAG